MLSFSPPSNLLPLWFKSNLEPLETQQELITYRFFSATGRRVTCRRIFWENELGRKWSFSGGEHSYTNDLNHRGQVHYSLQHCVFPLATSRRTAKRSRQNMKPVRFSCCPSPMVTRQREIFILHTWLWKNLSSGHQWFQSNFWYGKIKPEEALVSPVPSLQDSSQRSRTACLTSAPRRSSFSVS